MASWGIGYYGICFGSICSHKRQMVWFSPFLTRVGQHCGWLFSPLWANLAEILRGERARVWLQTMRISLGCVRGSSGWKPDKNWCFLPVFQQLLPHISTRPKKIHIVYSHTLACSPRKILARLTQRGRAISRNVSQLGLKMAKIVLFPDYDYKLTQNISHNIPPPMNPY